ncbi:hypothetical protein L3X38_045572 [Prunus dulcis]|uniref:Uncharacterized protein n=1 Tax=Prunus dulcis TaxID=3755 RepID=A0AAD4UPM6_PRUDU|nr:hypothetical protein L3X38_045572 [Prunus dulcis]
MAAAKPSSEAQRLRGSEAHRLRESERVLCSRIQALAADFLSRTGTWTSQTTSIITNLKPSMCSLELRRKFNGYNRSKILENCVIDIPRKYPDWFLVFP